MRTLAYLFIAVLFFSGCVSNSSKKKERNTEDQPQKGTYAFDRQFLKKYHDVIELKNGNSAVLLVADYQGRVMTSTCDGKSSFGWMNYGLISSGKKAEHINVYGGEERFWIGPEGGQFSIFFTKGKDFVFDNWYVPAEIDTEPFKILSSSENSATFVKDMHLKNYSDAGFDLSIKRTIRILDKASVQKELNIDADKLSVVAFRSENSIKNTGQKTWKKETGLLSIWLLSMLNPSDKAVIVIPVKAGDEQKLSCESRG